jgi:hypothetical protein
MAPPPTSRYRLGVSREEVTRRFGVICLTFGPVPISRAQYYAVGEKLPEAPAGRDYHVCCGEDGALFITEVWESREHLDRHSEALAPVLAESFGGDPYTVESAARRVVGIQRAGEAPLKVDGRG